MTKIKLLSSRNWGVVEIEGKTFLFKETEKVYYVYGEIKQLNTFLDDRKSVKMIDFQKSTC